MGLLFSGVSAFTFLLSEASAEDVESVLDGKLLAHGFASKGESKYWKRNYRYQGSRRNSIAIRVIKRRDDAQLLLWSRSGQYGSLALLGAIVFLLSYAIILSLLIGGPNVTLLDILPDLALTLVLFILGLSLATSSLRVQRTVGQFILSSFQTLGVSKFKRGAGVLIDLDSIRFSEEHPDKFLFGMQLDRLALALSLFVPVVGGIYLLLRRRGGSIRLLGSLIWTPVHVSSINAIYLHPESGSANGGILLVLVLMGIIIARVPIYQCGHCQFEKLSHYQGHCPVCGAQT